VKVVLSLGAGLLIICTLAACYPYPHEYFATPEFSGVLRKGGVPVSGATVSVGHYRQDGRQYCLDSTRVATTDEAGHFRVAASVSTHLFASMLNPPNVIMQTTPLCFGVSGEQKLGVTTVAATNHKVEYALSCEFDSKPAMYIGTGQYSMEQWGICKNPSVE
jgi:hypothetical protein